MFEFTQKEIGRFSQPQLCLLLELPRIEDVSVFRKIKVLVAPPGAKELYYTGKKDKNIYIQQGWKEISVGVTHGYKTSISGGLKGIRKQYRIKIT